ncbi:MAG: hypothetical protein E7405_03030 [Ruminococcaceae bacterium]|nr:hypothetical protein [Oscillospiraceae bacterium]
MKRNLKDNLWIKIISVLIAIVLWFYIQMIQNPETEYTFRNMNVSFINSSLLTERNLVIMDQDGFNVDVTVNCPRWFLNELSNEDFVAYVDMSDVRYPGVNELPVKVRMNNENIIVMGKNPSTISVNIDEITTVEKPLKVEIAGKVDNGYYTSYDFITPSVETVKITGPKSIVANIKNALARVDLNNRKGNFTTSCKIILINESDNTITDERVTMLDENVDVDVKVYSKKKIPVNVSGIPDNISYSVIPKNIEIAGEEEYIEKINEIRINNFRLSDTSVGYTQKVEIKLDENLILISDVMPEVKVTGVK